MTPRSVRVVTFALLLISFAPLLGRTARAQTPTPTATPKPGHGPLSLSSHAAPVADCIATCRGLGVLLGDFLLCEAACTRPVCLAGLLETGQTQCDQGKGTLGACPGSPAGQDGAVLAGAARSYTDNGDGTVTDNVTGLMWEKLSNDGTIHDKSTLYSWYTAFTKKIAALNGGGGFAGHTDWRLPNSFELHSLTDLGRVSPAIDPAFNTSCAPSCTVTTCSCTQPDVYWSSTTYQDDPSQAWLVDFSDGYVAENDLITGRGKTDARASVRAVRGGSPIPPTRTPTPPIAICCECPGKFPSCFDTVFPEPCSPVGCVAHVGSSCGPDGLCVPSVP